MTSRITLTAFSFCTLITASVQAEQIYWTDPDGPSGSHVIRRANADGSGTQALITGLFDPRGMAIDASGGKMYWTEPGLLAIRRANLDGTNIETVVATGNATAGVAIDLSDEKMYWAEGGIPLGNEQIRRSNLDGSGVEVLVSIGLIHPVGIALDTQAGKVYWTDLEGNLDGMGTIKRANFDGSNVETIITGIDEAAGLALDAVGGKIYWPDLATKRIQRANLDGSGTEDLVVGLDSPTTISLDLFAGKMYWTDSGGPINQIYRANLDGSGVEVIVSGVGFPWGISVLPSPISVPTVWYVDDDNCPAPGSGTQGDPSCSIQDAIGASAHGDEIIVAAGIYLELINFLGKAITVRSSDGRDVTIIDGTGLNNSVVKCVNSEGPDTVLEGFTITGGDTATNGGGMLIDNSSPSVTNCTFTENTATEGGGMFVNNSSPTLINCVFTENSAVGNGAGTGNGGGVRNSASDPTFANCTFSSNTATTHGGGMANDTGSSPTVANCTFSGNSASGGGGMANVGSSPKVTNSTFSENESGSGGGMFNDQSSSPRVTNCKFVRNTAVNGGGMANTIGSSPTVTNCMFAGNAQIEGGGGGGMLNDDNCSPTVTNCVFSGNTAANGGGGMDNGNNHSNPIVANCMFSGNTAGNRGGGMLNRNVDNPTVTNCVFWGNLASVSGNQISNSNSTPTIRFSDIQGSDINGNWNSSLGIDGGWNIDANPLFMDPNGEDNTPGTEDDDLRLSFGSPCIDAGNNSAVPLDALDLDDNGDTTEPIPFDLDGNARFVDDPYTEDCPQPGAECGTPPIVDMGAYEFPCEADLPQVVHATGQPGETRPFTGYVDSLAESTNGEFVDLGIDEVVFVFNVPVRAIGGGELDPDSFVVTSTGGDPPTIDGVDDSQNPTIRVSFATLPPLEEWTTVVALVENLCGDPIESTGDLGPGVEEPDRIDFLFLPGDVDQNGEVSPFDLLRFRQIVSEVFVPTHGTPEDFVDTNRTGEITPFDLLMYRQLITGTIPATQTWNGATANSPQP
jgi:hypothetical protein